MRLLMEALHGTRPTSFQLTATYAVFIGAMAIVFAGQGVSPKSILLALVAGDWAGGVVANAAPSTRAWWRERRDLRLPFYLVHLLELPIVWLLTGGGLAFALMALVLTMKLSVFALEAAEA
ncbi:MAG: hypothetical protein AAFX08_06160 [Pseudomonadota bacterium]